MRARKPEVVRTSFFFCLIIFSKKTKMCALDHGILHRVVHPPPPTPRPPISGLGEVYIYGGSQAWSVVTKRVSAYGRQHIYMRQKRPQLYSFKYSC